jgi:hypothetical protein
MDVIGPSNDLVLEVDNNIWPDSLINCVARVSEQVE